MKLRLGQIEEKKESDMESMLLYATHSTGVILRAYNYGLFCDENDIMAKLELSEDENGYACIMGKEKASTIGVMQEDCSKVTYSEGTVLLEASYIPPEDISKKMAEHKMSSSHVYYRASRGSEPELNAGLTYCINLLE
jgi:phenylalanyl-tRNA synthetase beta chain